MLPLSVLAWRALIKDNYTMRTMIVSGKISRGERQLKKQQEQSLKSAHDKLRVSVPVEHFLIQELSHGKYLAKDLLLGQQAGSGADTPLDFKDLPKRSNKSRTNKEEGEDDAPKKPDNDVDPAHPDGDHHGGDGGKNSDMGQQSSFKVSDHFIDRQALFDIK